MRLLLLSAFLLTGCGNNGWHPIQGPTLPVVAASQPTPETNLIAGQPPVWTAAWDQDQLIQTGSGTITPIHGYQPIGTVITYQITLPSGWRAVSYTEGGTSHPLSLLGPATALVAVRITASGTVLFNAIPSGGG